MGILKITDESFDPLMGDIWEVWPQSWGDGNEQHVREFSQALLEEVLERAGYFHYALGHAVVTTRIHGVKVPDEAFDETTKVANELVKIVRRLEPSAKYITIKFGSNVSGGGSCIPNIEIRFDSEWFGKDFRTDEYGPWHQRHAKVGVHLKYKVGGYKSWGGTMDIPTYDDIYPDTINWPKDDSCWGCQTRQNQHEFQVFFPEGEQFMYRKTE